MELSLPGCLFPFMKKILLLEDDAKITSLLKEYLTQFDYSVHCCSRPSAAYRALSDHSFDAMILDVMLPEEDGFSVLKKIRLTEKVPVIMLTARGDLTDRVVGLELGADDYLAKPFEPRELLARIAAMIRRNEMTGNETESEVLKAKDIVLDTAGRTAVHGQTELQLTSMEFELLCVLVRNRGIALSRDRITEIIHGDEFEPFNRTIDILISRIRNKLNDTADNPEYIRTVRGVGYQFLK